MSTQNQQLASDATLATPAEQTAVSRPTVAAGLGYPANRNESSDSPTGWQATRYSEADSNLIQIEK